MKKIFSLVLLSLTLACSAFGTTAATLKGSYSLHMTQSYDYWYNASFATTSPSVGIVAVVTFNGINSFTAYVVQIQDNDNFNASSASESLHIASFSGTYLVGTVAGQPGFVTATIKTGPWAGEVFTGVVSSGGTRIDLLLTKGSVFGVVVGTAIRQ